MGDTPDQERPSVPKGRGPTDPRKLPQGVEGAVPGQDGGSSSGRARRIAGKVFLGLLIAVGTIVGFSALIAVVLAMLWAGDPPAPEMPHIEVRNVFDEMAAYSSVGYARVPMDGQLECLRIPEGFDDSAPSGTEPDCGEWVSYRYDDPGSLGAPWEGFVPSDDPHVSDGSLSAFVSVHGPTVSVSTSTPQLYAADGKVYTATIGLNRNEDTGEMEYFDDYGVCLSDQDEYETLSRDEWLSASGVDGERLDAWAEHNIRDVLVYGYLDANSDWSQFSRDDLGRGVDLSEGFLARMRDELSGGGGR